MDGKIPFTLRFLNGVAATNCQSMAMMVTLPRYGSCPKPGLAGPYPMKISLRSLFWTLIFTFAAAAQLPAQDPFVERVEAAAKKMKWKVEVGKDNRWMLVSGAGKESTERVVRGLEYAHLELDRILGLPTAEQNARWQRPAVLFYVPQKKSRQAVVDLIAPAEEAANEEWRKWARRQDLFAYPQEGYAFQKQSSAADAFGRYLVGAGIHCELARRYGAFPYWLAEGINMALQQRSSKWVGAFLAVDPGRVDLNKIAKGWPQRAQQACEGDLFAELVQYPSENVRLDQLSSWFAIGFWAVNEAPVELRTYLQLYSLKGRPGQPLEESYHVSLVKACFGPNPQKSIDRFWESGVKLAGTAMDIAEVATKELADFAAKTGLKEFKSKDGQWQVWAEASVSERNWISVYDKQVEWVSAVLPKAKSSLPAAAFVASEQDTFRAVCDVSAEAAPVSAGYIKSARESSGFSSGHPPLVAVWLQDFGEGYDQTYEVARQMMLVKLMQHCGPLPAGLLQGMSTALQKMANGEVRAHHLAMDADFIQADLWDSAARRLVAADRFSITDHWVAPWPVEFDRDRELLCYAFAKFMFDAKAKQTKNFLKEYRSRLGSEGSAAMTATAIEDLVVKHYGKKWRADLQRYWRP